MVFKPALVNGDRFFVCLENGHAYDAAKDEAGAYIKNTDGKFVQGNWAGIFHRTGGPKNGPWIDETVPEPTDDDDDGDNGDFRFDD
jgi:hypothetical protein